MQAFSQSLLSRLSGDDTRWLTTRYWRRPVLDILFREVRKGLADADIEPVRMTNLDVRQWFLRHGLVRELPVRGETFFAVGAAAAEHSDPDPLELLLAARPHGVICYFSAVGFHGLTVQPVRHHHVAVVTEPARTVRPGSAGRRRSEPAAKDSKRSLGTLMFEHQGLNYYETRRSPRLMPGVQRRRHGPGTTLRITTREQTLLDTLHKPFRCGGPEVVFEAWAEAFETAVVDQQRLAEHLDAMDQPLACRRTAAMLRSMEVSPEEDLARTLAQGIEKALGTDRCHGPVPLLPGTKGSRLDESARVWLP